MPQMAPLSWINLFILFSIILMLISSMNYFSFNYKINPIKKTINKKINNWKW